MCFSSVALPAPGKPDGTATGSGSAAPHTILAALTASSGAASDDAPGADGGSTRCSGSTSTAEALARRRVEIEVIDPLDSSNKMTSNLIVRVREPRDDWSRIAEVPQERVTDPRQHDQLVQLNIKLIAGAIFRRFLMQDEAYVNLE